MAVGGGGFLFAFFSFLVGIVLAFQSAQSEVPAVQMSPGQNLPPTPVQLQSERATEIAPAIARSKVREIFGGS